MPAQIIGGMLYADGLKFTGFSQSEIDIIRTKLASIYNASPKAQVMLDMIPDLPDGKIVEVFETSITTSDGAKFVPLDTIRQVHLNLAMGSPNDAVVYINEFGRAAHYDFDRIMMHELTHAIVDVVDTGIYNIDDGRTSLATHDFDFRGPTVNLVNSIMEQFQTNTEIKDRTSYASISNNNSFTSSYYTVTEYTFGLHIDETIIDYFPNPIPSNPRFPTYQRIDQSVGVNNTSELILGLKDRDLILAGPGDDFVYGGASIDILVGGPGNDYLNGADPDGATVTSGDAIDTADYSGAELPNGVSKPNAIVIELYGTPQNLPGAYLQVVNDGEGGADILVSIEQIIATGKDDTLLVKYLNDNFLNGSAGQQISFQFIDGKEGVDTADFSLMVTTTGIIVDFSDTDNQIVQEKGGVEDLTLKNFEDVKGTNQVDEIKGSEEGNSIEGGLGDDWLFASAGNDKLNGGGGGIDSEIDGVDTVEYTNAQHKIHVDLTRIADDGMNQYNVHDDGWGGTDLLISIERIIGSSYDDTFVLDYDNYFDYIDGGVTDQMGVWSGGADVIEIAASGRASIEPGSGESRVLHVAGDGEDIFVEIRSVEGFRFRANSLVVESWDSQGR